MALGYGAPMAWETKNKPTVIAAGMYTFEKRSVPYPVVASL